VDEDDEWNTSADFFTHKVDGILKLFNEWFTLNKFKLDRENENEEKMCTLFKEIAPQLSDHGLCSFPLTHDDLGTHNAVFGDSSL